MNIRLKILKNAGIVALLTAALLSCRRSPGEASGRHVGMGRLSYQRGEYESAEEMFLKALQLDPANADAALNLAILYDDILLDQGRAERYYRLFLEIEPSGERARLARRRLGAAPTPPPVPAATPRPAVREPTPPPAPVRPLRRVEAPAPSPPAEFKTHTVVRGDTLAGISGAYYGDRNLWRRIYEANRDILPSANALQPGQVLRIPPAP